MIKTYHEEHTCIRPIDNHNINHISIWIANKLKSSLRVEANMSYDLMLNELRENWSFESPIRHLYRTKQKPREINIGLHDDSYKCLNKNLHYLKTFNLGSKVYVISDEADGPNEPRCFKRVFVILEVIKPRFLNGCWLFINSYDYHLKGSYGGIFLCAIVLDDNRNVLPLHLSLQNLNVVIVGGDFTST